MIFSQFIHTNQPGLHDMRVKADREKEEAAATKKAVAEIDKTATAQYERDRAAAEAARKALGSWVGNRTGARARFIAGRLENDAKRHFLSFAFLSTRFPTLFLRSKGTLWSSLWNTREDPMAEAREKRGKRVEFARKCTKIRVSNALFDPFYPSKLQDNDESGHLYNATLRYYYNKCVWGMKSVFLWKVL